MPYAENRGVRVYYEVEGQGFPLALVHGFGMSIDHWRAAGYVSALRNDYQLIMVDLRGHGKSDKPYETNAYDPDDLARDLTAVLDRLGCERVHYFGHSGGASLGCLLAASAPKRFQSLILGGYGPYLNEKQQDLYARMRVVVGAGLERLLAGIENSAPLTSEQRAIFMANDINALAAFAQGSVNWPPYGHLLPAITAPALLFSGENDPNYDGARECVGEMRSASFVGFPDVGHLDSFLRSDLVLPHVLSFLARVGDGAQANGSLT